MLKIAFIGLGIMGSPMAANLASAGYRVTGYSRTTIKAAPLVAAGGRATTSIADAVRGADVICVMVPDSPDVEQVLTGAKGVFDSAEPGALIIDFSTIRPDISASLAERAVERGFRLLDAPVSGGEAGAIAGTLSIMVGGDPADFEAARPILETVGTTVVRVGPNGAGQTVKAANQLIVAANIQALAEAVIFLEAHGADTEAALRVLGGGLAGSKVLDQKKDNMLSRSFAPGFRIELHHKDLGIVTAAARAAGVVLPFAGLVAELVADAKSAGDGGLDHSALLRGVERLNAHAEKES